MKTTTTTLKIGPEERAKALSLYPTASILLSANVPRIR